MADTISISLGERTFHLDREKAEEAYAAKKVINGRNSMFFNILPLKYTWAYSLYKEMKNSHWEPGELALQADVAQWSQLDEQCKALYKMALGAFAKSQDLFCSGEIYTIRDLVTAPELKLVFGRFVHEENTRSDILVYLHGSMGIDPAECKALSNTPAVVAKQHFVEQSLSPLARNQDTTTDENKQAIARNIFLINQCMEGTQFYSLWAALFSLAAQNKIPGSGKIFSKLFSDTSYRISLFDKLLKEMVKENPEFWTESFQQELIQHMTSAVKLEQDLAASIPLAAAGVDPEEFNTFVEYLADNRLAACGLSRYYHHSASPFPWLDEQIHLSSAQPEHVASATLAAGFDDDDL